MKMPNTRQILNSIGNHDDWYKINNDADKPDEPAEVFIYDHIGFFGTTAGEFVRDLQAIDKDDIRLRLASPGGNVFDGIAIFNALRTHKAQVTVQVDSMAASIASVIAQAGDRRIMVSGSQMMIHDAWIMAVGTADELREQADILDKQTAIIADIYAERSGEPAASFRKMMKAETWMNADETVANGLADEILNPGKKTDTVDDDVSDDDEPTDNLDWSGFLQSMEVR